jgi:hypothetical protein
LCKIPIQRKKGTVETERYNLKAKMQDLEGSKGHIRHVAFVGSWDVHNVDN